MDMSVSGRNLDHINRKMASGRYPSTDEVLGRALRLLDEHDHELEQELSDMRASVLRGTEQADAGQLVAADEVFGELRRRIASMSNQIR